MIPGPVTGRVIDRVLADFRMTDHSDANRPQSIRELCRRPFAGESVTANGVQESYRAGCAITDVRQARGT
jgi:hypothetical protein